MDKLDSQRLLRLEERIISLEDVINRLTTIIETMAINESEEEENG